MVTTIRGLLYGAMIAPLLLSTGLFFPFITTKMLFFGGCVLAASFLWLIIWGKGKSDSPYVPSISWLTISLLAYIGVSLAAALQGANFWRSFWSTFERMDGIFTWIILFLFFFLLGVFNKTKEQWTWTFRVSLLVSIIIALWGGSLTFTKNISVLFGSPIYVAVFAIFHVGIALYLLWTLKCTPQTFADLLLYVKDRWGMFYIIGLLLNILTLFLTLSRGPMLGFLIGVVVGSLWYALWGGQRKLLYRAGGVVLLLLALTFPLWKDSFIIQRLSSLSRGLGADETRAINWGVAWNAFQARPLFGWGSNNYLIAQNEFYNPRLLGLIKEGFDRPHNKYLEVAVDSGIIGLVSYGGIFVLVFIVLVRARKKEPFLTALFAGIISAYLVQNSTAFDNPASYIGLFLTLAIINDEFFDPLGFSLKPKPIVVVSCLLLVVGFFWQGVWQPYRANKSLVRALTEEASPQKSYQLLQESYKKALSYQTMGDYEIRVRLALLGINAPENTLELLHFAIRELEKELQVSTQDILIHVSLAKLYDKAGFLEEKEGYFAKSEAIFKKALALAPGRSDTYQHYAIFLLNQRRGNDTRQLLEKLRAISNEVFEGERIQWYMGMSYYVEDNFVKAYEQFRKVIGQNQDYLGQPEYLIMAKTNEKLGQYQEMVRWYEDLYRTDTENPDYNIYLSVAYKTIGDIIHAQGFAKRAVRLNPDLFKEAETFIASLHITDWKE